jgi:predicted glycosyltransferase
MYLGEFAKHAKNAQKQRLRARRVARRSLVTVKLPNELDLVWGAKAIGELIDRTPQQAYHLMATGKIPAKHIGNRWVVSRKVLSRFFEMGYRNEE